MGVKLLQAFGIVAARDKTYEQFLFVAGGWYHGGPALVKSFYSDCSGGKQTPFTRSLDALQITGHLVETTLFTFSVNWRLEIVNTSKLSPR